ncbi:methyl-accepting chemotaxis protein [Legionella jamestowniensis]|uniref:Chemotaxis signal transducer n=1 Tax=Legionella jamestowniensis TaxID=455 RepID=A0A0W0UNL6_9GAMM|nr:methyl-accepting chemotaxis protein [Legionella jamestowniensis]KTD09423.1 chemotaxis signal transducer [Legionella jamestowniensis]OCH99249.1 hypothetical protein A8135_08370 [Legionella jamestowniensis]SFL89047.1 methyl-accepting chemotaxis protein [Legionella jamestowniensis DSM 19215]
MDKKEQAALSNEFKKKYIFGFISLIVVCYLSMLLSLAFITQRNDTFAELLSNLSLLTWIQSILLPISLLFTALTIYWWFRRERHQKQLNQEIRATLHAIAKSQAIIEFDMDGTIITANEKFLDVMGYTLDEIVGKHHSIFVDREYKLSSEYIEFWKKLNRGEYDQAEYKRLAKGGKEIWLLSTYNPIFDANGKPVKIIKVATDITDRKQQDVALMKLTNRLKEIGAQIIADSNEISTGINQLEATAVSQADSASQQATSVNEISTTIEEIKATAQQTLEKAKQLGESASRTNEESDKGRSAIELMSDLMKMLQEKMEQISTTILSLNDKTQQISEITEAVADIAKQSKMLALNASIEAAKAGESGKGFAVVAGEVKELAEKSQLSTERVQKILQDIRQTAERAVMATEDGNKSVQENIHQLKLTGDIIQSLGDVIEESSLASLQIVSAVREETVAIEQVDVSIKEINKVTSLFSSAAQQTKQAILGLGKVAQSLKNTSSAYKENEHDGS